MKLNISVLSAYWNNNWKRTIKSVTNTNLNPMAVAAAIGWLARENKIIFIQEGGNDFFYIYQECYY